MAGLNQPGVSYQFYTSQPVSWSIFPEGSQWTWDTPKQARTSVQLSQSGYSPLQMPYVMVGLGQTRDYVTELQVGIPSAQLRAFAQAIIPNSRLVVTPYPYELPAEWTLMLYLEPRQQFYVAVAILGALGLIGLIILILELRERAADASEKRKLAPALPL